MAYRLIYANQGIRNLPLSPFVTKIYEQAANRAGIDAIRVVSGGQEATGKRRTGSHRHDLGGAGDIQLLVGGRALDFTKKEDLPQITSFLQEARSGGLGGIGAGSDYMGNTTFHVGGGSPSIWGAGGRSANAPGWLTAALGGTPVGAGVSLNTSGGAPTVSGAPVAGEADPMETVMNGLMGRKADGSAPAEVAPSGIAPPSYGGGGSDISAGAASLLSTIMANRRRRYGLSLMGMPDAQL